ncbi:MAG: AGE family epimerase/isomerase [Bacteroidia bacterium]|nr:AGE family epimerase/isomerase [Bacteroidia bacterium]
MIPDHLTEELSSHRIKFEQELCDDILPFWINHAVKPGKDGLYGAADLQGNPVQANLSCVLTARILWTYSEAAILYNNPDYIQMAHLAFQVLQEKFLDPVNGGYFMEIAPDGTVAADIKHTYAQAFVIYALSKYMEFVQDDKVLGVIRGFYFMLESKAKDPVHPGYFEAFTRDWKLYDENRMADNNEPRSMNTHLHVMEAYAALIKVWSNERVRVRLTELLELFIGKIIRPAGHLGIFFDENFNEAEASKGTCSFGHDIEASWLLMEAAEILGDKRILEQMKPLCIRMAEAVAREGVDQDGGLFLESTRFGSHLRTNKHWWPQAENLVGFMNAFEMTGDPKYWETVKKAWNFIDTHLIDHQYGEWFTKVNRLGVPYLKEPPDDPSPYYRNDWKIDPWKCPYHNGRAMMEMMRRCDNMLMG